MYQEIIFLPCLSTDCDMKVFSLQGWCNPEAVALADWPDITDKELYNFMVYKCNKAVDKGRKNARRQLKAHVFYDDRHVHSVSYHPVAKDSDQCYLKCLVIPSAASSNTSKYPDRKVWLSASKVTGQIAKAYCDCTAGREGSCNHVSAFLYALVDITAHKQSGLDASTSAQCKWNMPRKRKLSPKKAADLQRKKARLTATVSGSNGINLHDLAAKLKSCNPDCGFVVNFLAKEMPAAQPKCMPSNPMPDFMFADSVNLKAEKCTAEFEKFASEQSVGEEDILLIEQETRQQSESTTWAELRHGKLTSSIFGQVCKKKATTQPDGLLKTILRYRPELSNDHIKWGKSHEAAARRKYTLQMRSQHHINLQVRKCGLLIDSDMPFLATSPDGLVHCQHCQPVQGLLEVKCPSVHRNKTPEEACSDSDFCCQLIDGQVRLKENHNYFFQVQGQMGVSGKLWCDFVIWTLKGMSVERIPFQPDVWVTMKSQLKSFYVNAVVPELFTNRVKRGLPLFS
ncbi:uncharacterized protein [Littorina saxatilis]|uniref:uncharacterized protein n=1 Tax=Littorina saxatilis TaxID=31220 RepID=UPI0038B5FC4C